jgi:uncharacterized protein (TIGR02145 family)
MKYLGTLLFLFFFEFAMGQIPGTPSLLDRSPFPSVHTLSYTTPDLATAVVSCHVINSGVSPVTVSGILWGTSVPSIQSNLGVTTNGGTGGTFTSTATSLPFVNAETIYIVAYATTSDGKTHYGNILTFERTVQSPYTGKIWMAFNLGATKLPTVPQTQGDLDSYGHLYQWGRSSDGHQIILPLANRNPATGKPTSGNAYSETTSTRATLPSNATENKFILHAENWLNPSENTLWQGTSGTNNPCPAGFRVPDSTDFANEIKNFSPQTFVGAFNSFLRLPTGGLRNATNGTLINGTNSYFNYNLGRYWTTTPNPLDSRGIRNLAFGNTSVGYQTNNKSNGYSVRCIKGEISGGGSAVVSALTSTGSTGTMLAGEQVLSTVTQTLSATVSSTGTYDIAAAANGVTFRGTGTFTTTGPNQPIVLTATGTPELATGAGSSTTSITYVTSTTPSATFTRSVAGLSSNGRAEVSSYTFGSSTGTMIHTEPVTNVKENFVANVTIPGSYNLTASSSGSGITYTARGTFINTGNQNFDLTASGTPAATGTFTFTSNTTPSATFTRTINSKSTNGLAIVSGSGYTIPVSTGTMRAGDEIQNGTVYQTMRANVTKIGNYNLSTNTINGVTFTASGTFTSTGADKPIVFYASGTPTLTGSYNYISNTTPSATFTSTVLAQTSSNGLAKISSMSLGNSAGILKTGRPVENLTQELTVDVTRVGTYSFSTYKDAATLELADLGNNRVTYAKSGTFTNTGTQTVVLTASGTPWAFSSQSSWTINTTPTVTFTRIVLHGSTNSSGYVTNYETSGGQIGGNMKKGIPVSGVSQVIRSTNYPCYTCGTYDIAATNNGVTFSAQGQLSSLGNNNITLTASGTPISVGSFSYVLNTVPSVTFTITTIDPSTNGTAAMSFNSIVSSTGTLKKDVPVQTGVNAPKTIVNVNVTTLGTYNISATNTYGVTFTASGTFTNLGDQDIVFTATGTPSRFGTFNHLTNTIPIITIPRIIDP